MQLLTTPSCKKFVIFVPNLPWKIASTLIDLSRGLTNFDNAELSHKGDDDQVCLKYMKLLKIHGKPQIPVNNCFGPVCFGSLFVY